MVMMRALALGVVFVISGCLPTTQFECAMDQDCGNGRCEADGFCSFPDPGCDSGRRYGEFSGPRAGACSDVVATPLSVAHLDEGTDATLTGLGDLVLDEATIDTTTLTVSSGLPEGARFIAVPQRNSGPELALLDLGSLRVMNTVTVTGDRPLVVVAATRIEIAGTLLGAARGAVAGPNGSTSGAGPGHGTNGGHGTGSGALDSGGGGGSYGSIGGAGGSIETFVGGSAGGTYGDAMISVLQGGSGGGAGGLASSACTLGGAGGGAIQLTARTTIVIDGGVDVGGGGGQGDSACGGTAGTYGSGGGGGTGGAIYLQAPDLAGMGILAANGGGGGAGGATPTGAGAFGANASMSTTPAPGGMGKAGATSGGDGATTTTALDGEAGNTAENRNTGGGGGGVGRIFLDVPSDATITLISSPDAARR
jgi:hypothetical protein